MDYYLAMDSGDFFIFKNRCTLIDMKHRLAAWIQMNGKNGDMDMELGHEEA